MWNWHHNEICVQEKLETGSDQRERDLEHNYRVQTALSNISPIKKMLIRRIELAISHFALVLGQLMAVISLKGQSTPLSVSMSVENLLWFNTSYV